MSDSTPEPILQRLTGLHPKKIDLSLGRIERLLVRLGDPHLRLPPVLHIAGTNGKGSTLAMLDAMLSADGRRVHRYISPHLVRFNERILLAGRPVDDGLLVELLQRCETANAGRPVTFFEITTAAAFLAFAENPADAILLETGLGGIGDATNLVPQPLLTMISPVSMDHESFLGNTRAEIAVSKAGILKPGTLGVLGAQEPDALAVIEARAAEIGAPLLRRGREWDVATIDDGIIVRDGAEHIRLPRPVLDGVHQIDNAGLATVAARHLGVLRPSAEAIAAGLTQAVWPARLQRLRQGPLLDLLTAGSELRLDGGHNPAAGEVMAASLPRIAAGRPIQLMLGMLTTKDLTSYLRPLLPLAASLTTVPIPGEPAAFTADAAARAARDLGFAAVAVASPAAALERIAAMSPGPSLVLICGSLYLAGQILREHE